MRASNELYAFCSGMSQNSDRNVSAFEGWIASGLSFVGKKRLPVFRGYLNELLSGRYSNSQLEAIYNSTDPEIAISGEDAVRFLFEAVRDTVDRNLQPGDPDFIDLARQALLARLDRDEGLK